MKRLRTLAGISAVLLALIYAIVIYYFQALWSFPYGGDATEQMAYLYKNQLSLSTINVIRYVVFACLLSILVTELYHQLKTINAALASISSLFGAIWIGLLIAGGMLSNAGIHHASELFSSNFEPDEPLNLWATISTIVEGIVGGGTLVGGIWVLLVSVCAPEGQVASRPLSYLGIFVGVTGVATVYPDEVLFELFRGSQMVWFMWLGIFICSRKYGAH